MQTWFTPFGVAVLWGPLGLSSIAVASLAVMRRLGRGQHGHWPAGGGRRLVSVLLLLVALASTTALAAMAPVSRRLFRLHGSIGTKVPDVAFRMVADGAPRRFAEFKGQVVVLNIWATWCPACRHELPVFNRLQAAYRDRGLVVLNLSDEGREDLAEFARTHPLETVNGCVDAFDWDWFNPANMRPFTLIIDREGFYREMALSGEVTFEQLDAQVRDYL